MARLDAETKPGARRRCSPRSRTISARRWRRSRRRSQPAEDDAALDDAQRVELLQTVLEETDRLNRLLGNLLGLARFEAGALTP